jgi:hypothetical protein
MIEQKEQHPPPQYWFAILIDAMGDGDLRAVQQADQALRDAGIEVLVRKSVPVSELLKIGGASNG